MGRSRRNAQVQAGIIAMCNWASQDAVAFGRVLRPVPGVHAFAPACHVFLEKDCNVLNVLDLTIRMLAAWRLSTFSFGLSRLAQRPAVWSQFNRSCRRPGLVGPASEC